MDFFGRDFGEYEMLCLRLIKQAYHDLESRSEKVRSEAIDFFEDPDKEDFLSYLFMMEHLRGYGYVRKGDSPLRQIIPYAEDEGGQVCFYFHSNVVIRPYVPIGERLKKWSERAEESVTEKNKELMAA